MCVCGNDQIYMHLEKDGSIFSVDDCSLSDLPEYENCEAIELGIEGRTAWAGNMGTAGSPQESKI